jgi:pimeloyl-ACP methyl ester carboxylesterase
VTTDEDEIAAWSWGRGPAVLLVHGWAGQAAQLAQFVEPLVSAGFRAVTFDMPGHGASTGRELSVIEMAQAIRAVAQVVGSTHAVIAHSLGGTAAIWALRNGLEAERLVFFAPPAEPTPFALALAAAIGLPASRTPGMLKRIEERVGTRLADLNVTRVVTQMTAQLLVIHDPEDAEVPFKHGESIASSWPGAQIEAASGLAHRRMLRDPRMIRRAVAFISARGPSNADAVALSGSAGRS